MAHVIPRRHNHEYVPLEVRRIVLYQREILQYTSAQICVSTDIPLRTVQRILQRWRELGEIVREPHREGPRRVMNDVHIKFVLAILAHSPDLYLEEIRDELWYRHNVNVPLSTLDYNLKELDITTKSLSKRAIEQTLDKRVSYLVEAGVELAERFVFVDESAVNMLTTYRSRGRAKRGERAYKITHFVRGDRYSVLPALSLGGLLWIGTTLGSFNGPLFIQFLDGLLAHMNPWPEKNSVLVMDNCAIHHIPGVKERCEQRGVRLIYLPPYSPDLNPIEEMFSSFKAYIRRHGARLREIVRTKDHHRIVGFFLEALNEVARPDNIAGWFRKYKHRDN